MIDFQSIWDSCSQWVIQQSQIIWDSCSRWFEQLLTPVKVISGLVTIIGGCWALKKFLHEIPNWRKTEINKLRAINGAETLKLVKSSIYIKTMGQREPPHSNDSINISSKRFPLIEYIIDDILNQEKALDDKRYMILGGSGMGKTTFSVALFYKYINCKRFKKSPYPIYIQSLMHPNVLQEINKLGVTIEQNAIIILDALDERSFKNVDDVGDFIEKVEEATRNFLAVIITCRTQFFPDGESEPDELKIRKTGGAIRKLSYDKIYISPFNKKESKKYLRRKFGLNIFKYLKAKKIIDKCEDTLTRPMILSFIGDFMKIDDIQNLTTFEIYSHIIDKWFDREIDVKPKEVSKEELFTFSKQLSLYMYNHSSLIINEKDYKTFIKNNGFENSPFSFKARSLVNRNKDGGIKFSHKSFWEFFMALIVFEEPGRSLKSQKSVNTNMSKLFFKDLCSLYMQGKTLDIVQFNKKRLACNNSIFCKRSIITSYEELKDAIVNIPAYKSFDDTASRLFLIQLDLSINLIFNLTNTDVVIKQNSHHNHHNPNIFQIKLEEKSKNQIASIFQNIADFCKLLIISIQEYFESYDMNVINQVFSKGFLDEFDSKIIELYLVKYAKFSYSDPKNFDSNYSYFSNGKTRIKMIGSSSLFFHQFDELINDVMTSKPIILLKDSDNIDELVDFINEFHSHKLKSMIFLSVKFQSSMDVYFNYVINNTTRLWDKQKIKSILTNMISTCEKNVSNISMLQQ